MSSPKVSTPAVRKALKLAAETGKPIAGYELTPEGTIRVMFATAPESDADAALAAWQRRQGHG
jgi:hypothetical protein